MRWLQPGENPREVLSRHAERGPKRFKLEFTYADLAYVLGMSEGALRTAVHREQIDPESLESIGQFLVERVERGLLQERSLRDLVGEARRMIGEK